MQNGLADRKAIALLVDSDSGKWCSGTAAERPGGGSGGAAAWGNGAGRGRIGSSYGRAFGFGMVVTVAGLGWLEKGTALVFAALKPLGIWGLGGLAFIDAALVPLPTSMDGAVIGYVVSNPKRFFLYCVMAAAASALGSLVPYYVGRAGGELFLLKRINRERYERMRDRFEKQEFLAIMIPAMMPPPMPIKLFEFGAGVFEMKPVPFTAAIFCGKLVQFVVCSVLAIRYGPAIVHTARRAIHEHFDVVVGFALLVLLGLAFFMVRKIFDRRRGIQLPVEE